jgi:hypothetical protein
MSRLHIFADESGDFTFSNGPNISRYFIVCTVSMESCDVSHDLLKLRRALAWENGELRDHFHASAEKQTIRDAVFGTILQHDFTIQATIMEKCKAQPQTRTSDTRFYQYGWYYHFFHGMQTIARAYPEIHVTAASIGIKKERQTFKKAISAVMRQTIQGKTWSADVFPAGTDPCLQVADYCSWAIQKKWERGDDRSYELIKDRITYEFDLWAHGTQKFY